MFSYSILFKNQFKITNTSYNLHLLINLLKEKTINIFKHAYLHLNLHNRT